MTTTIPVTLTSEELLRVKNAVKLKNPFAQSVVQMLAIQSLINAHESDHEVFRGNAHANILSLISQKIDALDIENPNVEPHIKIEGAGFPDEPWTTGVDPTDWVIQTSVNGTVTARTTNSITDSGHATAFTSAVEGETLTMLTGAGAGETFILQAPTTATKVTTTTADVISKQVEVGDLFVVKTVPYETVFSPSVNWNASDPDYEVKLQLYMDRWTTFHNSIEAANYGTKALASLYTTGIAARTPESVAAQERLDAYDEEGID